MAAYTDDKRAAKYFGVTPRSIDNWRKRLRDWPQFAKLFDEKRQAYCDQWIEELGPALRETLRALLRGALEADVKDPNVLVGLGQSVKILSGIAGTNRILSIREKAAAQAKTRADAPNVIEMSGVSRTRSS